MVRSHETLPSWEERSAEHLPDQPSNTGSFARNEAGSSRKPFPLKKSSESFHWLKYGEKLLRDRKTVRTYYRCSAKTDTGCEAKKMVDVVADSGGASSTHFRDSHNHPSHSHEPQERPLPGAAQATSLPPALGMVMSATGVNQPLLDPAFLAQGSLLPPHGMEAAFATRDGDSHRAPLQHYRDFGVSRAMVATSAQERKVQAGGVPAEVVLLEHLLKLHWNGVSGGTAQSASVSCSGGMPAGLQGSRALDIYPDEPAPAAVPPAALSSKSRALSTVGLAAGPSKRSRSEEMVRGAHCEDGNAMEPVASLKGPSTTELSGLQCHHAECNWLSLGSRSKCCGCYGR